MNTTTYNLLQTARLIPFAAAITSITHNALGATETQTITTFLISIPTYTIIATLTILTLKKRNTTKEKPQTTMLKLHNTTDTCERPTGENDTLNCGVCNTQMTVKRNINTGNPQYNYDQFTCPHKNQPWHKQIITLRQEQQKTPSRTITNLLENEIQTIQQTRKPTK